MHRGVAAALAAPLFACATPSTRWKANIEARRRAAQARQASLAQRRPSEAARLAGVFRAEVLRHGKNP